MKAKTTTTDLTPIFVAAGLPKPRREYHFHPVRKWRFDYAWPSFKVALEIEGGIWLPGGGRHNRAKTYEADCSKYSEAACLGWRLIRCTPGQIQSGRAFVWLKRALGIEES